MHKINITVTIRLIYWVSSQYWGGVIVLLWIPTVPIRLTFSPNIISSHMKLWFMLTFDHNHFFLCFNLCSYSLQTELLFSFHCFSCRTVFATYNPTVISEEKERMAITSGLHCQLQCTCSFSPASFCNIDALVW